MGCSPCPRLSTQKPEREALRNKIRKHYGVTQSDPLSSWLRFRFNVGAPANIKDRISHLAESKLAALEHAYAAAGAAAVKHPAAHELLSCEIPERQSLEGHQYRTHLRL